jgi:hypothetical protein
MLLRINHRFNDVPHPTPSQMVSLRFQCCDWKFGAVWANRKHSLMARTGDLRKAPMSRSDGIRIQHLLTDRGSAYRSKPFAVACLNCPKLRTTCRGTTARSARPLAMDKPRSTSAPNPQCDPLNR